MYALLLEKADPSKLDKYLDEPLPSELSEEERRLAEIRRIADANRVALAGLDRAQARTAG